jgi:hypothetical protein
VIVSELYVSREESYQEYAAGETIRLVPHGPNLRGSLTVHFRIKPCQIQLSNVLRNGTIKKVVWQTLLSGQETKVVVFLEETA